MISRATRQVLHGAGAADWRFSSSPSPHAHWHPLPLRPMVMTRPIPVIIAQSVQSIRRREGPGVGELFYRLAMSTRLVLTAFVQGSCSTGSSTRPRGTSLSALRPKPSARSAAGPSQTGQRIGEGLSNEATDKEWDHWGLGGV